MALIFIVEGVNKFTHMDAATTMFGAWGIPFPQVTVPLVAITELLGGVGIFLGALPRFSAGVLSVVMITAILLVKTPGAFNDYRIELILLLAAVTIMINGPGRPTIGSVLGRPGLDIESRVARRWRRTGTT